MKIKIGIRFKVLASTIATLLIVVASMAYMLISQQSQSLTELALKNAENRIKDISFYSARAILEQNDIGVSDSLKNANKMPAFIFARVVRSDNKTTISSRFLRDVKENELLPTVKRQKIQLLADKYINHLWKGFAKKSKKKKLSLVQIDDPTNKKIQLYFLSLPIYHPFVRKKPPLLGVTQLVFSNRVILESVTANRNKILWVALIFLLLGSLGSLLLAYYLVKPIRRLSKGAEEIGKGNLDYKIEKLGNDELGSLAIQFNKMTSDLLLAQKAKENQVVLDEQIRQATEIQEGMNPQYFLNKPNYQVKGYTRAAKGVGGDYYDFELLEDGRLAVLISDVSGKSISASLVMVLIKTVFATYLRIFNSIRADKILTTINQVMCSQAHIDKFATFFMCLYDPKTKLMDFTNGGHGPAFLYRAKDKVCTAAKLEGLPMGIDEDNEYKLAQIKLNPGDIVILYTDGVNEAWDVDKNEWGLPRLQSKIKEYANENVDVIVRNIVTDIDAFTGEAEQHDDLSLVILKIPAT